MKRILFLCVENSVRSQMAEGLAKAAYGSSLQIESAGSEPSDMVQPYAVEVLKEVGVDISSNHTKAVGALPADFRDNLDFVITLCSERICPTLNSKVKIHWEISDPTFVEGAFERLIAYRVAREQLQKKIAELAKELKLSETWD